MVRQAGGEPNCALLDAIPYEAPRALQVVTGQRNIAEADSLQADGAMRHQVRRIDSGLLVVVGAKGVDAAHVQVLGWVSQESGQVAAELTVILRGERRVREAVLAQDLGGDPLPQTTGTLGVCK